MSVFFAVLSTISIGLGEFFAGGVAKRTRANELTSTMFVSGVVMMALITAVWPGDPDRSDLAFGALAGVANGVGILLLYFAYSRGSVRSAAPAAAVVMSAVPVVWDVIVSGVTPSALSWFGIGLVGGQLAVRSGRRAVGCRVPRAADVVVAGTGARWGQPRRRLDRSGLAVSHRAIARVGSGSRVDPDGLCRLPQPRLAQPELPAS